MNQGRASRLVFTTLMFLFHWLNIFIIVLYAGNFYETFNMFHKIIII